MIITTQSGQKILFTKHEDGSLRFMYGLHEGIVKKFICKEVGKPLALDFCKANLYTCEPEGDLMFFGTSAPVISIVE